MNKWISVKHSLPSVSKFGISRKLLVTDGSYTSTRYLKMFKNRNYKWTSFGVDGRCFSKEEITHWMDLPELPTDKDN